MVKKIPLSQGKFAIVEAKDYGWLSQWKWTADNHKHTWYAYRNGRKDDGVSKKLYLHREIMNPPHNLTVDHKDYDGLNCRRKNMRNCTFQQNQQNKPARQGGTSKFKGVSLFRDKIRWVAHIRINEKSVYLGLFDNEVDAAITYDQTAKEYFKDFAYLNFKEVIG